MTRAVRILLIIEAEIDALEAEETPHQEPRRRGASPPPGPLRPLPRPAATRNLLCMILVFERFSPWNVFFLAFYQEWPPREGLCGLSFIPVLVDEGHVAWESGEIRHNPFVVREVIDGPANMSRPAKNMGEAVL